MHSAVGAEGGGGRPARALTWGALLVFLLLLTVNLGQREFWTDEEITAGHVVSLESTHDAFHPRGYYLLLYAWTQLAGDGDLALRVFSLPWAVVAFFALGAVARMTAGVAPAILAQWLLALSPFIILYFRMARFYSMTTAVALLVALAAVLVLRDGRLRNWAFFGAAAFGLLHTSYVAAVLLGPLCVWLAVVAARRRELWRLVACLVPCFITLALKAPGLVQQAASISRIEAAHAEGLAIHTALRLALPLWSLAVGETTEPWRLHVTLPALAATMVGLIIGWRRARTGDAAFSVLRWGWPLAVVVVAVVLETIARGEPLAAAARSTIFAAPLAYALVAVGILSLRRRALRALALAAILVPNAYGLRNYFAGDQFLNPAYVTPWREVARVIEDRSRPDDMVVTYYDTTIARYGTFHDFVPARPDYYPDRMARIAAWPQEGNRLWLIARDRGSAEARRLQDETIQRLLPRAEKVEIFRLMPYSPVERRVREEFLGREMQAAYLELYLFTPPAQGP